jgi:hypothetical protein
MSLKIADEVSPNAPLHKGGLLKSWGTRVPLSWGAALASVSLLPALDRVDCW